MSTNVTWNGITYSVPASGETGWAALSSFLIALGNGAAVAEEMKQAIRVATTSPVTVSDTTDCVVAVNRSVAGATTVNLPAGTDGRWFVICDQKADAATNNITVTPNGAETINGIASYVMSQNNEAIIIAYSATNTRWNVVARFTSGAPLSNPMTSTGDMIYGGASGTPIRVATGATTGLLHGGNGAVPSWSLLVNADVSGSAAIDGTKLVAATAALAGAVSTAAQSFAGLKKGEGGLASADYVGANPEPGGTTPFTLTNAHKRIQTINLSADAVIKLPTTSIKAGERWRVNNRGTLTNDCSIQASDASAIDVIRRGHIELMALIDTPVASTDWTVVDVYEEYSHSSVITNISATSKTFNVTRTNKVVSVALSSQELIASKPNTTDPVIATRLVARHTPATIKRFAQLHANNAASAIGYATITTGGLISWSLATGAIWTSTAQAIIYENTFVYDLI